jgi:hypothetical protein
MGNNATNHLILFVTYETVMAIRLLLMITSETSEIPKSDKFDVLYNLVNNPIGKDLILEELNRSSDWFFSL